MSGEQVTMGGDGTRRALRATLTLLLAWTASLTTPALGQVSGDVGSDPVERLVSPVRLHGHARGASRARLARTTFVGDSIWIGHSIQTLNPLDHTTFSYGPYHVGVGLFRPKAGGSAAENSGFWDWDQFQPGENDSLQGWWPMRRVYSITGGLTLLDTDRPWWAVDIGNQGNYILNSSNGRTRGVLSYWHVDGGNTAAQVRLPATNAPPMTWAPLDGNGSAWCGLRAHGDMTYVDPITGNPYNATVMELNGENGGGAGSGVGTNKKFPGYPGQMDQMLYRDVEMTAPNASLNLTFLYQTAMSTSATSSFATRTGWFQFDPTIVGPVAVPGPNAGIANYVPNTGVGQPADSFMVYLGVPVDIDNLYLADGSQHVPGATPHGVYDLKRRWFSEVLRLDMPIVEVLHVSGNVNTSFTLTGQDLSTLYAAQGAATHKYLRLVFRCKTNRNFDDMTGSTTGQFNSGGKGAVMIDDVAIAGSGLAGGAIGTSGFEFPSDIDNGAATDQLAMGAWRATGKPPAVFFHTHPLSGVNGYAPLTYQDICGPPGSPQRFCNMAGVVISAGDHDHGEAAGGLIPGTPERERMDGILSPTILLASSGAGDYNACGVDLPGATPANDYYVWYDVYTGVFDLFFTGNAWWFGFQSYPAQQADGTACWGELRVPGFQIISADVQCTQDIEAAWGNGLIRTTNPGGHPDSLRIYLGKNQECFRFGVTGGACSSTAGAYFDNVSLLISDAPFPDFAGGLFASVWDWINDTFPANDNTSLVSGAAVAPGTAGFDTAAAYIKMGQNIAQSPGTANRFDIPGDSALVVGALGFSSGDRVDMVFRIKPGVGNYHTIGDPTSGLRPVPTDPVNIVSSGDNSFWGQYMGNPGAMSKGIHGPGNFWNRNVWNSARMDTADINIFPVQSNLGVFDVNANFNATLTWMATYHESDPKYVTLGIPHNRCFLVNPAGAVNSTNITCSSVPGVYGAAQGYDGVPTTREGTKIIPDGQLTPGAHVQYFFRGQADGPRDDVNFYMVPETTYVSPQINESILNDFNGSTDGHRWQQFGVLPDRWKDSAFNDSPRGLGMACMLYVDLDDRRGDERVWVSTADSLCLTAFNRRGAHNGWAANCDACITDANSNPIDVSTNPTIARYDHGGQPGSIWDMYGVKAAEALTVGAGQLGGREGRLADGLATGKDARLGPTPAMLRTYYKMLLILTGDLNEGVLGKFINRGADDVLLLRDFMTNPAPGTATTTRRAIYIAGDGFVQSEYKTGSTGTFSDHLSLLTDYLGVTIKTDAGGNPQYSYQPWSGNFAQYADLFTGPAPGPGGPLPSAAFKVGNACLWGNDVLSVVVNTLNAQASAYYTNFGTNGQYVASVYTPIQTGKFYESYVDAWDIQHLYAATNTGAISSRGRLGYFANILNQTASQSGLCQIQGLPCVALDVPAIPTGQQYVDFMSIANNPLVSGKALVNFGLARADRVTVRVYDVGGRMVRTLADRNFAPGDYRLEWDGSDDRGRAMPRGVYFTHIHYARTGFLETKKLTVLR